MDEDTRSFLAEMLPRQHAAEQAMRGGDAGPRQALWSDRSPVSWLGQFGTCAVGPEEVAAHFARVAPRLSGFDEVTFHLVVAEVFADAAYLVGFEHTTGRIDAGPPVPMISRISRVYRREPCGWRIAHGHADLDPTTLNLPWSPPRRSPGGDHE